jgi:hypothetical protein
MKIYVIRGNILLTFLKIINISDTSCKESQNTRFMFNKGFPKIVPFYEITWKNTVKPDRPQMVIMHMCIACCIHKATRHTLRICNFFPQQQLLHGCASVLRYTYVVCLVVFLLYVVFSKQQNTDVGIQT